MIRILVADDHLLFRTMLEEMLKKDSDIEIIASCSNGDEVIEFCKYQIPDMAILDIGMPVKNGIDTLETLKISYPNIKVVMLTTFEDDVNIKKAVNLGADGYLIKDMTPDTLLMSIKCIHNHMIVFHEGAYKLLQSSVRANECSKESKMSIDGMVFDVTDIKIFQLIVQGKSNKEIGALLNYSEGTIKNKVSKLLSITGFSDRTELSVFAINHSIV